MSKYKHKRCRKDAPSYGDLVLMDLYNVKCLEKSDCEKKLRKMSQAELHKYVEDNIPCYLGQCDVCAFPVSSKLPHIILGE